MEAAGEARGGAYELKVRATNNAGDTQPTEPLVESGRLPAQRRRNRSRHGGVRRMIMKRSISSSRLAATACLGLGRGSRARPVAYKLPEETAAFKPGPNLEVVKNNCSGLPFRRLHQDPAARAEIQEGFLAGRSDQDDQGLWRADRRRGRPPRSSIISPPPIEIGRNGTRAPARAGGRRAFDCDKVRTGRVLRRLAAEMVAKQEDAQMRHDIDRFRRNPMSFELSSVPHTAYLCAVGHAGLRGPAVRIFFLIPRRRRDG